MIIKIFRFLLQVIILGGVLIAAAGCSAIQPVQPTPTASLPAPTNTPISTPLPTLEVDAPDALIPIVIWLPPQFNPELDNTASQLLNARLAQFSQDHPQLAIIYRIKNRTGPAGLLDSLTVTSKVASQSLPHLLLFHEEELLTDLKSTRQKSRH